MRRSMKSGPPDESEAVVTDHASIVERALRVHGHLEPHELQGIHRHWTNLDHRLQSFDNDAITLHLFVKERETPSQHVTLEAHIPGHRTLVASAARADLAVALQDVRDSMVRQLGDLKRRNERKHDRELRPAGKHA